MTSALRLASEVDPARVRVASTLRRQTKKFLCPHVNSYPERRAIRANAQTCFVAGEGLRVVLDSRT